MSYFSNVTNEEVARCLGPPCPDIDMKLSEICHDHVTYEKLEKYKYGCAISPQNFKVEPNEKRKNMECVPATRNIRSSDLSAFTSIVAAASR